MRPQLRALHHQRQTQPAISRPSDLLVGPPHASAVKRQRSKSWNVTVPLHTQRAVEGVPQLMICIEKAFPFYPFFNHFPNNQYSHSQFIDLMP